MSIFWKILGIFMLLWFIWYFSGGPQRSDKVKPYLRYDLETNTIYRSNYDLKTGAKEMINLEPESMILNEGVNNLNYNLNNSNFIK